MNKHGQAIIEYALIGVLVILGIVFMGPYVLRSVNAHYKLWDDGVQDSFTENITQAPNGDLPIIPANCSCPISQGSCGSPASCGLGYRQFQYNCNIPGCNGALEDSFCGTTIDPSCCTGWVGIGCGSFTCPAGGCPTTPTLPSPDGKNCYYGYQIQVPPCGTSKAIQCVYNAQPAPYPCGSQTTSPGLCTLPGCLGVLSCPSVQACPNSPGTPGAPSLLTNDGIKFVGNQSNCTAGTSCQYSCANGYVLQNGICVLLPPVGTVLCNFEFNSKWPFGMGNGGWQDFTRADTITNGSYICKKFGYNYYVGAHGTLIGYGTNGLHGTFLEVNSATPFPSSSGVNLSTINYSSPYLFSVFQGSGSSAWGVDEVACSNTPNSTLPADTTCTVDESGKPQWCLQYPGNACQ